MEGRLCVSVTFRVRFRCGRGGEARSVEWELSVSGAAL